MPKPSNISYLQSQSGRRLLQESYSVSHGNRYCVPNALSAVTGLPVEFVTKSIRSVTGSRAIRGVSSIALMRSLWRMRVKFRSHLFATGKFGTWASKARQDTVYLITVVPPKATGRTRREGHMIAFCNGRVVCTSLHNKIAPLSRCSYRVWDIYSVFEIVQPGFAHGNYCFQGDAPERPKSLWGRIRGWFTSSE